MGILFVSGILEFVFTALMLQRPTKYAKEMARNGAVVEKRPRL
jgi:hypothetical protein